MIDEVSEASEGIEHLGSKNLLTLSARRNECSEAYRTNPSQMFVRMKADGTVPAKGFIANYTRVGEIMHMNTVPY